MEVAAATLQAFRLLFSGDADLWEIIALSLSVSLSALLAATPFRLGGGLRAGHF